MKPEYSPRQKLTSLNHKHARRCWGSLLTQVHLSDLKELSMQFGFSLPLGDVLLLEGRWYVTHTGLIRLARRHRCAGIHVRPVPEFSNPSTQRWTFEATVYKSRTCKGFAGFGDGDPSNVSPLFRGAEMRVAETRAVNRALRKAYGIGICSAEEVGSFANHPASGPASKKLPQPANGNGNFGGRTIRDRLCQLIRQHQLNATLVKSYATEFCGVKALRDARVSRSKSSWRTWPSRPKKIAAACFASSTAMAIRKRVPHEAPHRRAARR
jgi:hypothetical protein